MVYQYANNTWTQLGGTLASSVNSVLAINSAGDIVAFSQPAGNKVNVFKYSNNVWSQYGQELQNTVFVSPPKNMVFY